MPEPEVVGSRSGTRVHLAIFEPFCTIMDQAGKGKEFRTK